MTFQITQADREAAWPTRSCAYTELNKHNWLAGVYDKTAETITAFAVHRITGHNAGLLQAINIAATTRAYDIREIK